MHEDDSAPPPALDYVPVIADLFRLDPLLEPRIAADSEDGCWGWTGGTVRSRNRPHAKYGKLCRRRARLGHVTPKVWWLAHVYVYTLLLGRFAAGLELHHTCRDTLCVQPRHLQPLPPDVHAAEQEWLRRETFGYA